MIKKIRDRFWLEGVILVSIAAVGLIGNVLTGIVLKSFDDRNQPFNNLVSEYLENVGFRVMTLTSEQRDTIEDLTFFFFCLKGGRVSFLIVNIRVGADWSN